MHYRLVAKTADFTPEELLEKLQGFMPVADEAVHQYGCWKLARYADFAAFAADEGIDTDEARTVDEQDGILRQHGFALGDDHKIYEKVSTHFDSFVIKGIRRYKDVITDPRGVYAFISAAGDFYYVTERILKLLTDNIRNFKEESWNLQNRMNKLIIDTEKNSIFTLRLGGKRIVRYSLDLLDTQQKISFLFDFYNSVKASEFNEDITDFLAKEIDNAAVRKKEANERRKNKKKAEREQKAKERQEEYARKVEEARQKTLAAAEPMLHEMYIQSEAARQNEQNQYVSERV